MIKPPRWPNRFLRWYCSDEILETLEGDLYELYRKRLADHGKVIADLAFTRDVISACRPFAFQKKVSQSYQPNNTTMISHYFKVKGRNLLRSFLKKLQMLFLMFWFHGTRQCVSGISIFIKAGNDLAHKVFLTPHLSS